MNAKKDLRNRIRGWLPQEPKLKMPTQQFAQPQPIKTEAPTGMRSIPLTLQIAIFLPIFAIFAFLNLISLSVQYNIGLGMVTILWIVGLSIGAVASLPVTNTQLKFLSRENSLSKRRFRGEAYVLAIAFINILLFFFFNYSFQIVGIYLDIGAPFLIGWGLPKIIGFFNWEKKSKKRLYFDNRDSGLAIYTVPEEQVAAES